MRIAVAVAVGLCLLLCAGVVVAVLLGVKSKQEGEEKGMRLTAVDAGTASAALVVGGSVGGTKMMFQVDTGYSGPPVVSPRFLAAEAQLGKGRRSDVGAHFKACLEAMEALRAEETFVSSCVSEFVASNCTQYTGGCHVKTQTISSTSMRHSDLVTCGCIHLTSGTRQVCATQKGAKGADAILLSDISGPHILTMDYLLRVSPCVLWLRSERLELCRGVRGRFLQSKFHMRRLVLNRGSPLVTVRVGGARLSCVLDTGAGLSVSVTREKLEAMMRHKKTMKRITQVGVDAEEVCSDLVVSTVALAGKRFRDVPVAVTDVRGDGVDGYIGLGLLRCFDLMITRSAIGLRFNGDFPIGEAAFAKATTEGECGR